MPYGLTKITTAIGKRYALQDWAMLTRYCEKIGRPDLIEENQIDPSWGVKRIDRKIESVLTALGLTWSNYKQVLEQQ